MVICILEINFASHSPGCNIVWMLCTVFILNAVITLYPSRQYKSIADWKDPSLSGTKKKLPQNPIFDISKRLFIAPDINALAAICPWDTNEWWRILQKLGEDRQT